jgi:CHAT domain-containing protein/tetratricopeptide (TPR) repeat protein
LSSSPQPEPVEAEARTAAALTDRATRAYRLGRYDEALALLDEALATTVAARGEQHPDLLPILNRTARVYLQIGRLKDAWRQAERAVKIADAAFGSDSSELARPLASLAEAYFGLGLIDKCHVTAERALDIVRANCGDDHPETAKACVRLGVLLAALGDFSRARALHGRALAVMRACGKRDWIAAILASLAETHLAANEPDAARPLYEEAAGLAANVFGAAHANTGAYIAVLGNSFAQRGDEERALTLYRRALRIMRKALGELHPQVGVLMLNLGRLQLKQSRRAGEAMILRGVAILAAQQRRPRLMTDAYLVVANMLQPSAAALLFRKLAINDIESMRAHVARLDAKLERVFIRRNEADFRNLGDELICRGRLPEAQHVLAMIKEGELFHLTGIDARKTKVPLTALEAAWALRGARLIARSKSSIKQVHAAGGSGAREAQPARLRGAIARAGKQLHAWADGLVAAFADAEANSQPRAAASGLQAPAPGTALLQYLFAPDHESLNVILTTAGMQREHRITLAPGEVNRLIYGLREAMRERSPAFITSAQRLHHILIAPVADDFRAANIGTLALSLDGVLRYLPMAALHDGERYLVERFALVLTTDAVGAQGQARTSARAAGLGLSRPVPGYRPLTAVRDELAALVRSEKNSGVLPGTIWLDEDFTAQALRQALSPRHSVVHIASHFVFAAAQEDSSYLLLGDGNKFTIADLAALRFDSVDLMVLSACNTAVGGGHRQSGREIEGLGALARHRGARNVLATLWPVADFTSAVLMRAFYRHVYQDGLEPAQALRRAQLALLRGELAALAPSPTRSLVDPGDERSELRADASTRHPFYWAPYILMGEASRDVK